MGVSKTDPLLVIGGGAFGLSTVLHLLDAGFQNITVLDKDHEIPSRFSAANDLNKIVRAEYEDPFYTDLTLVSAPRVVGRALLTQSHSKQLRPGKHLCLARISTRLGFCTASRVKPPLRLSTP